MGDELVGRIRPSVAHLVSPVRGRPAVFVDGNVSKVVGFRDASVKGEKKDTFRTEPCQSRKSAVESRWVRCKEEIRSRKIRGFCARTESQRQQ